MWQRKFSLIVGDQAGDALDLSELRASFLVRHRDLQNPDTLDLRIYNLSDATAEHVQKEFTRVVLQAGYEDDAYGVIFDGQIRQKRRGRESPTDTYLDLFAADGDVAYNQAVVNQSLAAGYTQGSVLNELNRAFGEHGVTPGYQAEVAENPSPRGRVLYGMARDVARDFSHTNNVTWSIVNGRLQVVAADGFIPGTATVLNSASGMIGLPQQTLDGICVKALLNPNLRHGRQVQIDQKSVQRMRRPLFGGDIDPRSNPPDVAGDGFYRIIAVDHSGDTRGNPWYSDLVCIAVHGSPGFSKTLMNTGL